MTALAIKQHHAATAQPAAYDIKVRRMDFEFSDDIPEFWYDNDPLRTLLLAALSGGFPEGERFFIDSVRNFQDQVTDPELQKAIRAFIGQEGHHSKEHRELNAFLERKGYSISKIDEWIGKGMNMYRRKYSKARQLAQTAAVEHFTALLAEQFLLDSNELDKMDPRMATIWAWHAIEESEHKNVAFDVYRATVNDEWLRRSQMAITTVFFLTFTTLDLIRLVRESGHAGDVKMWAKGINYFWGVPGRFRKLIPGYLDYYRRDFHPSRHDNRALIEQAKRRYLGDKA